MSIYHILIGVDIFPDVAKVHSWIIYVILSLSWFCQCLTVLISPNSIVLRKEKPLGRSFPGRMPSKFPFLSQEPQSIKNCQKDNFGEDERFTKQLKERHKATDQGQHALGNHGQCSQVPWWVNITLKFSMICEYTIIHTHHKSLSNVYHTKPFSLQCHYRPNFNWNLFENIN